MTIINMSGGKPAKPIVVEAVEETPSTLPYTFLPKDGVDYLSSVTVGKDPNLVPGNVKKDVSIFGTVGTLEQGTTSNDSIPMASTFSISGYGYHNPVLKRFSRDELTSYDGSPPGSAGYAHPGFDYALGGNGQGAGYVTTDTMGRWNYRTFNASWWSSPYVTPETVIPEQDVTITIPVREYTPRDYHIRLRLVPCIFMNATDSRFCSASMTNDIAIEDADMLTFETDATGLTTASSDITFHLPETTVPSAYCYNNSNSYGITIFPTDWTVTE